MRPILLCTKEWASPSEKEWASPEANKAVFIHYNWQYEFMRPSIDEIVKAYLKVYGAEAREEDLIAGADSEEEGCSASEAEEEAEEEEAEQEAGGQ